MNIAVSDVTSYRGVCNVENEDFWSSMTSFELAGTEALCLHAAVVHVWLLFGESRKYEELMGFEIDQRS